MTKYGVRISHYLNDERISCNTNYYGTFVEANFDFETVTYVAKLISKNTEEYELSFNIAIIELIKNEDDTIEVMKKWSIKYKGSNC